MNNPNFQFSIRDRIVTNSNDNPFQRPALRYPVSANLLDASLKMEIMYLILLNKLMT